MRTWCVAPADVLHATHVGYNDSFATTVLTADMINGLLHGYCTRLEVQRGSRGGGEAGAEEAGKRGCDVARAATELTPHGNAGPWRELHPSLRDDAADDGPEKCGYCGQHILPDGSFSGDAGLAYVSGVFSPLAFI